MEESLADAREMIVERLGESGQGGPGDQEARVEVPDWEQEWTQEVQKVLELDAGWGWQGFWDCVERNLRVSLSPSRGERKTLIGRHLLLSIQNTYGSQILAKYKRLSSDTRAGGNGGRCLQSVRRSSVSQILSCLNSTIYRQRSK